MAPALTDRSYVLDDGLGIRRIEQDTVSGRVEILDLDADLAIHPLVEAALRSRAAAHAQAGARSVAQVRAIERHDEGLRLVADLPAGVRLADFLAGVEAGRESLTDADLFELAISLVRAVASVHERPGGLAHGAITPAHVLLTTESGSVLTDAAFGTAFEALQQNRETLWRRFGVALPAAASLHRFDQRTDVAQIGAVVLALALRRRLRPDEYPRGIGDLVLAATPEAAGPHASPLRMWLQQALQLHPRAVFGSAVAARTVLEEIAATSGFRRNRRQTKAFPFVERPVTMTAARCGTP